MKRRVSLLVSLAAALALLVTAAIALAGIAFASPPSGVTPTVLARGTFDRFNVRSVPGGPIDFRARSKGQADLVVRQHDYLPGSSTGWHTHPGPVFVTVTKGQLTFYEYGDRRCTPHVVSAGQGYVDNGRGHIGRNETDQPAQDVSVITAPVAGSFRGELDAPGRFCGF
jgi:quercetin dioxygenase-like cupin family protein